MPVLRRIAFILPRGPVYRYGTGAFGKYLRYAPLTLPTLISLIPPELGLSVEVHDEGVEVVEKEKIKADLVAVSSITGASKRAYAYADYFRAKGVPVVMGGVHATLMPEEAMKHADAVVTGIAVSTWPQLLKDFVSGTLKQRYDRPEKIDFSQWKIPARECYADKKLRFISINSVQASYGCPNKCDFCVTPYSCKGYHHRPISDVVEEVAGIPDKHFVFVDPSPIEDVQYAKDLYRALIPLQKKWVSPSTIKMAFDEELCGYAAQSGCKGLLIGYESVSQESIDSINKGFNTPDRYMEATRRFHAHGIAIMGCFVFGLETDDVSVFDKTLAFVKEANIDMPRFTVCTPYPGTPFHEKLKREGRIIDSDWAMYDCQHVVFRPARMSPLQLQEGLFRSWRAAYSYPSIIKRLASSRCFLELTVLSNLTYRIYGKKLPRYTRDIMTDVGDILGGAA